MWVYRQNSQEVCPWNQRFARPAEESAYAARTAGGSDVSAWPLAQLTAMDEAAWNAFTRGSALRRAGYAGLRRNVEVAMENRR